MILFDIVINLIESFLSAYFLCNFSNIIQKKKFIIITTAITFIITSIANVLDANFIPLMITDVSVWFILLRLFKQKYFLFNLFLSLINNFILDLSSIFSVTLVSVLFQNNNYIYFLNCISAKMLHLIFVTLLIKYKRSNHNLEINQWISILACMLISNIVIDYHAYFLYYQTKKTSIELILILLQICSFFLALYSFSLISKNNQEKMQALSQLQKKKYKDMSYNIIEKSKYELSVLEHRLLYILLLIKNHLETNDIESIKKIIDNYIHDLNKYHFSVNTGNLILDTLLSFKLKDIHNDLNLMINISKNSMYDNLQFINLIIDIINENENNKYTSLMIKENVGFCVIEVVNFERNTDSNILKIKEKYNDIIASYHETRNSNVNIIKFKLQLDPYEKIL